MHKGPTGAKRTRGQPLTHRVVRKWQHLHTSSLASTGQPVQHWCLQGTPDKEWMSAFTYNTTHTCRLAMSLSACGNQYTNLKLKAIQKIMWFVGLTSQQRSFIKIAVTLGQNRREGRVEWVSTCNRVHHTFFFALSGKHKDWCRHNWSYQILCLTANNNKLQFNSY